MTTKSARFSLSWSWLVAGLAMLVLFSQLAAAQGVQGSVAGVVKDSTGAVITGATVTLTNPATNESRSASTSSEGAFFFPLVDNGSYSIKVEKEGFKAQTVSRIVVLPGQQYSLLVTLQVGARMETVEVVAGQEIVNTSSQEISGTVNQQQVLQLPLNGRNPIELIRLQAGVAGILAATRNNTVINGARPGWTQLTQDGINI